MPLKLRRSTRKIKNKPIVIAASDRDKVSQWVPAATAVPTSQSPIVNTVTILTTASAGVYPILYTKTGSGLYTNVCFPKTNPVSNADTLFYSRVPVQFEH